MLCDLKLDFNDPDDAVEVTYNFDLQVTLRGAGGVTRQRCRHGCSITPCQRSVGLPLLTNFLAARQSGDGVHSYLLRIGVYKQRRLSSHIEHVPLWSDYLVVTAKPSGVIYSWASETSTPFRDIRPDGGIPLPRSTHSVLGPNAIVRIEAMGLADF